MQRSDLNACVKLFLSLAGSDDHASGMGKGVVRICKSVERLGSLNRAAKEMGMAYSKAWRIVKNTEEALGVKLFVRQGASGSILTEEAKALVRIFDHVEGGLAVQANKLLDEAFEECAKKGVFLPKLGVEIQTEATPELIEEVRSIERHAVMKR